MSVLMAAVMITMVKMSVQFFYLLSIFSCFLVYLLEAVAVFERIFKHMLHEILVYIYGVPFGNL